MLNPIQSNLHLIYKVTECDFDIHEKKGRPSDGGSHMSGVWGREKPRQASPKIYEEAASNPRPGDLVRQLSPLHQPCRSCHQNIHLFYLLIP